MARKRKDYHERDILLSQEFFLTIERMPDKAVKMLLLSMHHYVLTDEEPDFPSESILFYFWPQIKSQLDADGTAYQEKCKRNSENASKGPKKGEPSAAGATDGEPSAADATDGEPSAADATDGEPSAPNYTNTNTITNTITNTKQEHSSSQETSHVSSSEEETIIPSTEDVIAEIKAILLRDPKLQCKVGDLQSEAQFFIEFNNKRNWQDSLGKTIRNWPRALLAFIESDKHKPQIKAGTNMSVSDIGPDYVNSIMDRI